MTRLSKAGEDTRAGVTLLELVVVLVILGLILGVSGLAFTTLRPAREAASVRTLRRARVLAVRTGRPVGVRVEVWPGGKHPNSRDSITVLFLPDGRAIGPHVDPLTGVPYAAPQ